MSLDRWDPFREMVTLRDAMDRLLQQSLSGTGQIISSMRPDAIPMDVVERDDSFEVRAAIPGVKPDDVEVVVQGERLTIRAESRARDVQHGETWLIREHRVGSFQRSITLPSPVSSEAAEARIEHGILVLRLPKLQEVRPRRITVGSGGSAQSTAAGPDRVDQESKQSFPASDPPSWMSDRA
jgi:HSP20 family protein